MNGMVQILLLVTLVHVTLGNHVHDVEKELRLQAAAEAARRPAIIGRNSNSGPGFGFGSESRSPSPPEQRRLTFTVGGRNLDKENKVSTRLSLFYQTLGSDLNSQETGTVHGNGNPDWSTIFVYNWVKGSGQKWQFKLKGMNLGHPNPSVELPMGQVEVDVDTYVQNRENILVDLEDGTGHLLIEKTTSIKFKLGARNLAKKDTFGGKSDPYVKCYWRRGPDGADTMFAQTGIINNVIDAEWMEHLSFDGYQKGTDQYLHFIINDHDGITGDDFLGEAFLKLDSIETTNGVEPIVKSIDLINEGKRKGMKANLVIRVFPSVALDN